MRPDKLTSIAGQATEEPARNYLVPIVIEQRSNGERAYDIYSKMLESRIVMLDRPVDPASASLITTQLLYLEHKDCQKPIDLYISSPGGYITALWDIHDVMRQVSCPIHTICKGYAASAAAVLLAAGDRRLIMPNAEVMIHQPLGGTQGQASDIEIQAKHIISYKQRLNALLAEYTGRTIEEVEKASDRDCWMSAQEALEFGIVDEIIVPQKKRGQPIEPPKAG
jgi:ATP-dependent Clp protease protease subunit